MPTQACAVRIPQEATVAAVSADVSSEEWDAYVEAHPDASVYHRWAWRQVFEGAFRHRTEYLAARDARGQVVGVLPLVVFEHWLGGRFMVSLPFVNYGGVLADHDAAVRALAGEAERRARHYGLRHVELRRRFPSAPA